MDGKGSWENGSLAIYFIHLESREKHKEGWWWWMQEVGESRGVARYLWNLIKSKMATYF